MKKFIVGVANVEAYDPKTWRKLFSSKTQLDNTITIATSNKEVRGGQGNPLIFEYFFTGKFDVALSEPQWNINMLAATVGGDVTTGTNIWTEESVTLGAGGAGVVSKTPLTMPDGTAMYGWATDVKGTETRVTFTGTSFTLSGANENDVVCIRYFANDVTASNLVIPSNIVPSVIYLVMEAQLASDEGGNGIIGTEQIVIPRLVLDGSCTINLKSTDVASMPLKGHALAYSPTTTGACVNKSIYAEVKEIILDKNWYDDVEGIASLNTSVSLSSTNSTYQLNILAVQKNGETFQVDPSNLTFTSGTPATCTVSTAGLITRVAAGTSTITIAGKSPATNLTTTVNVTAS